MLLEDMMPMATVERSGFQKFCKTLLPDVTLPSRRTLMRNMNELYKTEKKKLISELQKVKYVSCTADLWSSHNRGFLGMTVHYVDLQTLDRVSHTLVCRRFEHTHTGKRIAQKIAEVLKEFGITDKVVNFVTDNAANMVKAFSLLPDMCHEAEGSEGEAVEADADGVENDVEVLSLTHTVTGLSHKEGARTSYSLVPSCASPTPVEGLLAAPNSVSLTGRDWADGARLVSVWLAPPAPFATRSMERSKFDSSWLNVEERVEYAGPFSMTSSLRLKFTLTHYQTEYGFTVFIYKRNADN